MDSTLSNCRSRKIRSYKTITTTFFVACMFSQVGLNTAGHSGQTNRFWSLTTVTAVKSHLPRYNISSVCRPKSGKDETVGAALGKMRVNTFSVLHSKK